MRSRRLSLIVRTNLSAWAFRFGDRDDDFDLFLRRYTGPMDDCDENQTVDLYDLIDGTHPDCNSNGIDDVCDIRDGTSLDVDGNGEPDECHCSPSSPVQVEMLETALKVPELNLKNRFLSFSVGDLRENQVIRVKFINLPGDYSQFNGKSMWVGRPFDVSEIAARTDTSPPTFKVARLQCDKPTARSWGQLTGDCANGKCWSSVNAGESCNEDSDCVPAIIHVYSPFIVPSSGPCPGDDCKPAVYEIRVLDTLCNQAQIEDDALAPPLLLETSVFGDVCAGLPRNNDGQWGPADGTANMSSDVLGVKQKFGNMPVLAKARAELGAATGDPEPDLVIDMSKDVRYAKEAFQRRPYDMFFPPPPWACP
jgi:hypothetical protein